VIFIVYFSFIFCQKIGRACQQGPPKRQLDENGQPILSEKKKKDKSSNKKDKTQKKRAFFDEDPTVTSHTISTTSSSSSSSTTPSHTVPLEHDDVCHVCTDGGLLLECSECVQSFHFSCLDWSYFNLHRKKGIKRVSKVDDVADDWCCEQCNVSCEKKRKSKLTVEEIEQREIDMISKEQQEHLEGKKWR